MFLQTWQNLEQFVYANTCLEFTYGKKIRNEGSKISSLNVCFEMNVNVRSYFDVPL